MTKERNENPRVSRRKEIIKIRGEINAKETKETIAKNNKVNVNGIILINNYLKCKWVSRRKEMKIRAEISEKERL